MPKSITHPWRNSKPGDVFALQLSENRWAFMRRYRNTMGVLPVIAKVPTISVKVFHQFAPTWHPEFLSMNDDRTVVIKVGHLPFDNLEDAWAPPYYRPPDALGAHFRIYHKGKRIPCSERDVVGMAPFFRRQPSGLRDFLLEKLAAGELQEIVMPAAADGTDSALPVDEGSNPKAAPLAELEQQAASRYSAGFNSAATTGEALAALSGALNAVWDDHGEITDTEIRERMFDAVFRSYLHRIPNYVLPETFATDSPEGDAAVRAVLSAFISAASRLADAEGLDTPQKRLDAFYSDSSLGLDEFFGWMENLKPPEWNT